MAFCLLIANALGKKETPDVIDRAPTFTITNHAPFGAVVRGYVREISHRKRFVFVRGWRVQI
jgi:hypothetical protein